MSDKARLNILWFLGIPAIVFSTVVIVSDLV